jgi:hypothetical protein
VCLVRRVLYLPRKVATGTGISLLVALGFLPGKEVKEAKIGNLGLQDRELARCHPQSN